MAHGITITEVATGVRPAVSTTAGLPVYVGTAPIRDETAVNVPRRYDSLADAIDELGSISPPSEWGDWTLHEAIHAHFSVYSVGPIVCINVLNPDDADHTLTATNETHVFDADGEVRIGDYGVTEIRGVIKSTVVVKVGGITKANETDYTLEWDDDGYLVITRVTTGTLALEAVMTVTFDYFDPDGVTATDIIGGYSSVTDTYTGLEVVEQVFPVLRLAPGFILAPKWSQEPTVAARMITIATLIDGTFRCMAIADLSTSAYDIASPDDAPGWKTDNGFDSKYLIATWPKVRRTVEESSVDVDYDYHLSTVLAAVANKTDNDRGGIPYASPSNQLLTATAAVTDEEDEINLTKTLANSLNDNGIVTVMNGINGWKLWGNRTSAYPANTDPKDAFIPIRRMFNWIENTIILTVERDVDQPGNRRLIDGVVGTVQAFLNGLIAQGALIDGTIEFRADQNPATDLSNGIYRFRVTLTPPSPAESIVFTTEYNPDALAALFA